MLCPTGYLNFINNTQHFRITIVTGEKAHTENERHNERKEITIKKKKRKNRRTDKTCSGDREWLLFCTVINTLIAPVTLQFDLQVWKVFSKHSGFILKIYEHHQDLLIKSQLYVHCYLAQIINKNAKRS